MPAEFTPTPTTRDALKTLPPGLYELPDRKVFAEIYNPVMNEVLTNAEARLLVRIGEAVEIPHGVESVTTREDGMQVIEGWDIIRGDRENWIVAEGTR
jgi:hypothetical protein